MKAPIACLRGLLCLLVAATALPACAQQQPPAEAKPPTEPKPPAEAKPATEAKPPPLPTIADEPKLVDPATLMPAKLAAKATVNLADSSLRELVDWLRDQQGLVVLLEKGALAQIDVLPSEPISDRLADAPLYLLLNRLRFQGLDWYYRDDILHITSPEASENNLTTAPYPIGDLLDAGYDGETLQEVIVSSVAPDQWEEVGGAGVLNLLGDVMFVRQTDEVQRRLQGLLAALRKHGRQTFVFDPPQHLQLREKLQALVNVDYMDTPLETAVQQLAKSVDADIRLDMAALREVRIREREPITLKLADCKLETVLQAMLLDLELTWTLRDGVLWLTSKDRAESFLQLAVYDVRDLCRDVDESTALGDALLSQTESGVWDEVGGPGSLQFARPGTLVVSNRESVQMEVLKLLETYRTALRLSKPRDRNAEDPNALITVYYRMHSQVAQDLAGLIPRLVAPESWSTPQQPDAQGQILIAASRPDLFSSDGQLARKAGKDGGQAAAVVVARSVLIVKQTRAVHDQLEEVIRRVESGDAMSFGGMGGMGGMGGGFGGGFFSVPPARR